MPVSDAAKDNYRGLLHELRREGSQTVVSNRYPWHTRIATKELLEHAADTRAEVRLLSGSGTEQFYNSDIIDLLVGCLRRACSVRILIWNEKAGLADTLTGLGDVGPGRFEWKYSRTNKYADEIRHLLLVGTQAFRLEKAHDSLDDFEFTEESPELPARICFNDEINGKALEEYFDTLWDMVSVVPEADEAPAE